MKILKYILPLMFLASTVFGTTNYWDGSSGNWTTAGHWSPGLPGAGDVGVITNGTPATDNTLAGYPTIIITNASLNCNHLGQASTNNITVQGLCYFYANQGGHQWCSNFFNYNIQSGATAWFQDNLDSVAFVHAGAKSGAGKVVYSLNAVQGGGVLESQCGIYLISTNATYTGGTIISNCVVANCSQQGIYAWTNNCLGLGAVTVLSNGTIAVGASGLIGTNTIDILDDAFVIYSASFSGTLTASNNSYRMRNGSGIFNRMTPRFGSVNSYCRFITDGGLASFVAGNDEGTMSIYGTISNGVSAGSCEFQAYPQGYTGFGKNTLILYGTNGYTGETRVSLGQLTLGSLGCIPSGSPLSMTNQGYGCALEMNGFPVTFGSVSDLGSSTASTNIYYGNFLTNSGALALLTLSSSTNQTITYNGDISGSISLLKAGTFTQKFTGNLRYTGNTTNSAGTIIYGASQSRASTNAMAGGTLQMLTGVTITNGTTSIESASVFSLASGGTGNYTCTNLIRNAGNLTISNWTGTTAGGTAQKIFSINAPSATTLSNVNFAGFPNQAQRLGSGEIVPLSNGGSTPDTDGDFFFFFLR
jgi:hypothetical protein